MGLKGLPNVLDIRTVGLTVGIDLAGKPDAVGKRGYRGDGAGVPRARPDDARGRRHAGALSPPLIVSESQIGEIFDKVGKIIKAVA